jgi:peptide/nickel transport system permease protein
MRDYLLRRLGQMLLVTVVVMVVSFLIVELPPGDFLTTLRSRMTEQNMDPAAIDQTVEMYRVRYGLGENWFIRFGKWAWSLLKGDMGYSMLHNRPARDLIGERLSLTLWISAGTLVFMLVVAIPIGMLSAIKQYSIWDHFFTFVALLGVSVPSFITALVFLFLSVTVMGAKSVGGLYSPEFVMAPWSWAKFFDLMSHVWVVLVIVGLADTAGTIRVMRAKMLDTLGEPYIDTARMKGLSGVKIYFRHALRVAMNPIVSSVGLRFPQIISGSTIVSIVLTLPLIGPLLLESLLSEDVYLACSILVMLTLALIVGNFIADLALVWLDPRIRYES